MKRRENIKVASSPKDYITFFFNITLWKENLIQRETQEIQKHKRRKKSQKSNKFKILKIQTFGRKFQDF